MPARTQTRRRTLTAFTVALAAATALTACSDPAETAPVAAVNAVAGSEVSVVTYDISPDQQRVKGAYNAALNAQLPEEVRQRGTLTYGNSAAGGGSAPLVFLATDNTTPIGVEVDIAHLVGDILGLKPTPTVTSWENLFIGLDAGTYDLGISNVGVSEARKEKYDFATYRLGLHAFETKKDSDLVVKEAKDISGLKVGTSSGTLQEAVLLNWNEQNAAAGIAPAELLNFKADQDAYLALQSGRIDAWITPNPSATYHAATAGDTRIAGTVSSSYPIQGKVGVITRKDNGLVGPINEALNQAIADGTYAQVIEKWGLDAEKVERSEINPAGLPKKK